MSHPDYVFVNESIILPVSFLAKPLPNIERISWQMHSGDVIRIMHPGDVSITYTALCTAPWWLFNPSDKCKKIIPLNFIAVSIWYGYKCMSNTQNTRRCFCTSKRTHFLIFRELNWYKFSLSKRGILMIVFIELPIQDSCPIHLYLIFEKSSLKNQVRQTGFLLPV